MDEIKKNRRQHMAISKDYFADFSIIYKIQEIDVRDLRRKSTLKGTKDTIVLGRLLLLLDSCVCACVCISYALPS